ncbi:MAG: hypothetical protein DRI61_11425, partial [Chloroflexi bacterium]
IKINPNANWKEIAESLKSTLKNENWKSIAEGAAERGVRGYGTKSYAEGTINFLMDKMEAGAEVKNRASYLQASIIRDIEMLAGIHYLKSHFKALNGPEMEDFLRINSALNRDAASANYLDSIRKTYSVFASATKGMNQYDTMNRYLSHRQHGQVRVEATAELLRSTPEEVRTMFNISEDGGYRPKRLHDLINIEPFTMNKGYTSAMRNAGHIGKAAIVGTFIAMGINQLMSGYSIPDLAQTEGLGGEYWEKKATKKSEHLLKPRPPRVEPLNPGYRDNRREELALRRDNNTFNTRNPTDFTREQDYRHSNYGVKIK